MHLTILECKQQQISSWIFKILILFNISKQSQFIIKCQY